MASQMSTIDANLVAAATLFTNDVYKTIFKKNATKEDILLVTRIATVGAGVMMIIFAYAVPKLGGAVNAYLTLIGIVGMPLFVIAIVYGLLWRRANEKGALWAYLIAAFVAGIARFGFGLSNNLTTFLSAGIALVVCPIASRLTEPLPSEKTEIIWNARKPSKEEIESGDEYNIMPKTFIGKLSMGIFLFGFLLFVAGTLLGMTGTWIASLIAFLGMLIYFIGGLMKFSLE
jgi:Na+/proline symporter